MRQGKCPTRGKGKGNRTGLGMWPGLLVSVGGHAGLLVEGTGGVGRQREREGAALTTWDTGHEAGHGGPLLDPSAWSLAQLWIRLLDSHIWYCPGSTAPDRGGGCITGTFTCIVRRDLSSADTGFICRDNQDGLTFTKVCSSRWVTVYVSVVLGAPSPRPATSLVLFSSNITRSTPRSLRKMPFVLTGAVR